MKLSKKLTAKVLALAGETPWTGTESAVAVTLPPSVNNLFATCGNRRVKTAGYKAWLDEVVPIFRRLMKPQVWPVRLTVTLSGRVNLNRDCDNCLKPIGDAIVAAGVLPDDSLRYVGSWLVWYRPGSDEPATALVHMDPIGGVT